MLGDYRSSESELLSLQSKNETLRRLIEIRETMQAKIEARENAPINDIKKLQQMSFGKR